MKKYQKLLNLTLITGLAFSPVTVLAMQKSETIYSNLNYDGSSYSTTVSNHLSWLNNETVEDDTELQEILNISGEETFEKKENKLSWNANGSDIFYQGKTEKATPIKTEIKYYLNEEEKTVEEMLGKEGDIKISINFENTLKNIVKINGQNTEIYTPFVTTVGTMLDSKYNKNITITNGKVTGTGSRNMIIGIASPGLSKSMNLKELEHLDNITITYKTTNFTLNNIYIISTPKLLEETDLNIFKKMDNLYNDMRELQENMDKLEQGTKELASGAESLSLGSNELKEGIKKTQNAINELQNGSSSLEQGLTQIVSSLQGAKKELSNLNLESSLKDLKTLKTQNLNTINVLIQKTQMTEEQLGTTYTQYNLKEYKGTDQNLLNVKSTYELILLLKANNTAIDSTITNLNNLSKKLNTLLNTLEQALTSAKTGATKLNSGLVQLKNGINTLYLGSVKLNDGTRELQNGAKTLSNGASEFNKQGIQKLNHYVNTIKNYTNKIEALLKLSEEYRGFTSENSDNVNFISIVKSAKITYKR